MLPPAGYSETAAWALHRGDFQGSQTLAGSSLSVY